MSASLYHAHHRLYAEDLAFWRRLAVAQGDPVLELGCGTGRVALELAQDGHRVIGLDRDAAMLAVFQAQVRGQPGLPVDLVQADMVDFHLAIKIPLAIMPCNTFSTFQGRDRLALLHNLHATLQPGGVFAVSLPNPGLLSDLPEGEKSELQIEATLWHPDTGNPVQVSSGWHRLGEQVQVRWVYDQLIPDGRVERSENVVQHLIFSMDAYQAEFASAGFSIDRTYGDFTHAPYTGDSAYLILVAHTV